MGHPGKSGELPLMNTMEMACHMGVVESVAILLEAKVEMDHAAVEVIRRGGDRLRHLRVFQHCKPHWSMLQHQRLCCHSELIPGSHFRVEDVPAIVEFTHCATVWLAFSSKTIGKDLAVQVVQRLWSVQGWPAIITWATEEAAHRAIDLHRPTR